MNKIKFINVILPIILLMILLFTNIGDNFVYIISLTMVIGWFLPYVSLILTGISMFNNSHKKLALFLNITSILLSLIIIFLIVKIFEKSFTIALIEYIIITILSTINTIIIYKDITSIIRKESKEINKIKKENNGIIK